MTCRQHAVALGSRGPRETTPPTEGRSAGGTFSSSTDRAADQLMVSDPFVSVEALVFQVFVAVS